MHDGIEGSQPRWRPQWKEVKTQNGYLYVAQADGLLYPKGILIKPIVAKDPIDPETIQQALLINYYQEPGNVPEPKGITIMNENGSIMVSYSPLSVSESKSEIGPYVIQTYATKGESSSEVIVNISTHFEEGFQFAQEKVEGGKALEIPNIASASIFKEGGPIVQWNSYDGYHNTLIDDDKKLIQTKKGTVQGIDDQVTEISVKDTSNKNDLMEIKIDHTGRVFITQYDWEETSEGLPKHCEIDVKQKLDTDSLKAVMAPWDIWQNILSQFGDKAQIENIFHAAVKLDKKIIKTNQSSFSDS